ncbi:MAG: hypothetical protein RIS35_1143 [Pseudomonadota bacterium]|jgi:hypothetical protein
MKKSITQVLVVLLMLLPIAPTTAQPAPPEIAPNAPDRHIVVPGDTLWDIAARFLQKPWRWPEVWQLNRDQIRNPHLIHPGDIIYLDRSAGEARLRLARPVPSAEQTAEGEPEERRSPRVRVEPERIPIPTIEARSIEPFLTRPLIVDENGLARHPRIVATQDGRVYLSRGDLAYVRGITDDSIRDWHVYRSAKPLLDPATRKPIAWEARYLGDLRLERAGDPAVFRVIGAVEEMGPGDRLMPAQRTPAQSYAPRPPEAAVTGRIIAVHRGVTQAGRHGVVAIDRGAADGLSAGHVLAIGEQARTVKDRESGERVRLPGETIGHLLLFRIFEHISYGLIMRSARDVTVGDAISTP